MTHFTSGITAEIPAERIVVTVDEDLEDLIPGFLENRLRDIVTIGKALEKDDFETISVLGHGMKGAGGGFGFDDITDIGMRLEVAALSGDRDEIVRQAGELSNYLQKIEVVYA